MGNELSVQNTSMDLVMGADLQKVTQQLQAIANFQAAVQSELKKDRDYGVIPGTNKPTLLKPGAEKIQMLFGVTSEYEEIERIQDYDKGFFAYTIKCTLSKGGQKITEGMGHCNTKEKKYVNQDPYSLANTCLKMAKKRAQIDATLTIASLSEVFTQDIEDIENFNRSEQLETMTYKDAGNMKVTFGKYKGKTLSAILKEDASYIHWLSEKAKEEVMRVAATMLLQGEPVEQKQQKSQQLSNELISEMERLADIVGELHNVSRDQVFAKYGAAHYKEFDEKTAREFIEVLSKNLGEQDVPEHDQQALFGDMAEVTN